MLFELIWQYRFLYRDLNDLLSNNRRLETHFQAVLQRQVAGGARGARRPDARPQRRDRARATPTPVATAMVVVLTYWLSYEYVRDPRHALEPDSAGAALLRGAFHVLSLLLPYLEPSEREHLHALVGRYTDA